MLMVIGNEVTSRGVVSGGIRTGPSEESSPVTIVIRLDDPSRHIVVILEPKRRKKKGLVV